MASKININLDTSKENYLVTKCKQNDNLTLEAFIYENGLALDLTNKTITIQALKSDNTYIIQNTDIVKENNKINAELDRDFSRVPGTTKIEIVLVESSKQNTTFSFYLEVVASVIRGAVQSSNTATILEALDNKIIEAGQVKQETEELIESGGAAKKEDIININASLEQITKYEVEKFPSIGNEIDDTLRIRRAIASVENGEVIFSSKTYKTSLKIEFNKSNTIYRGIGGTNLISIADDFPFIISGTDIVIEGITFKQMNSTTIYKASIEFAPNTKRVLIRNCKFIGENSRINISNLGISDITITNCYFEGSRYGILVNEKSSDMRRLNIVNNIFLNMIGDAIELNTPNTRGVGLKEVVVTGNIMQRDLRYMVANNILLGEPNNKNAGHAFGASGLSDAVISNNVIDGFYWSGIDLEDESERVVITGNKIKNCYGDAVAWAKGKNYKKNDMVKSNGNIYLAQTDGIAGETMPIHTSGENSDGGVIWLYLIQALNNFPSFPTGINIQDASFVTINNNICEQTGFSGIVLENRQGYVGSDDGIGNTYVATISGNVLEKSINGIYVATAGNCEISITGNTCSLNSNAGIYVRRTTSSISYNDNMLAENTYGFYLDEVYAEAIFSNNVISRNINAIGLSDNVNRGGARFNKLTGFNIINTKSGGNTGNQEMFTLGKFAKGTVSMTSRSNTNDYVNKIWEVTWDGTTLNQTQVYSYINGHVSYAAITMVGDKLNCSITNNGATNNVEISLVFDGIMYIR
ncbi:MAG: right-handed parallel beta-helix repeat-containing protein [Clostridium sp.]|nr:right-handed parallel beta-helix repeat-containing protein [Clostridium sp.]